MVNQRWEQTFAPRPSSAIVNFADEKSLDLFEDGHPSFRRLNHLVPGRNRIKRAWSDVPGEIIDDLIPAAFQGDGPGMEIVLDPFLVCEFVCHT